MFGHRPQNTSYCALYHDEPDYKFHMICVQLVEKCWPYLQDRMQNQIFLRTLLHAGKSRRRRQIYNKMQAVMANFAPGAATWLTGRICVVFDSGSFTLLWENMTSSSKHIALSSEEDRATVTGNVNRLFGEIRTCGFLTYASDQTDRQTTLQYLASLLEVKLLLSCLPRVKTLSCELQLLVAYQVIQF